MLVFDVKLIRDFGHCEDNIGAKFGFRRSCIVSHVDYFSRYERISTYLEPGTGYAWVTCSINSQTAVRVVCVCQRQSFSFTQVSKSIFGLTVSLLLRAKNNISLSLCVCFADTKKCSRIPQNTFLLLPRFESKSRALIRIACAYMRTLDAVNVSLSCMVEIFTSHTKYVCSCRNHRQHTN